MKFRYFFSEFFSELNQSISFLFSLLFIYEKNGKTDRECLVNGKLGKKLMAKMGFELVSDL